MEKQYKENTEGNLLKLTLMTNANLYDLGCTKLYGFNRCFGGDCVYR